MKKDEWQDDGKVIADMNVEGMPWYHRESPDKLPEGNPVSEMSDTEYRAYQFAALKAGLIIAGIFGLVFFLAIAFMDFVWLR